ncbi:MAG: tRNA (cytidine(56)-2'-O)-methyltransferase [Nitrososphaerales archaeon]
MRIAVLRIGHRYVRDYRVTTHLALVARAFGAERMLVADAEDEISKSISEVNEKWGGDFQIEQVSSWKSAMRDWKTKTAKRGRVVHLTMYGINVDDIIDKIRGEEDRDLLVVVGAEKVPREVYDLSDYNVSIGNQPHSEIAALAVFLDRLFEGRELRRNFSGKIRIVPSVKGKNLHSVDDDSSATKSSAE